MRKVLIEVSEASFQGLDQKVIDLLNESANAVTLHNEDGGLVSVIKDREGQYAPHTLTEEQKAAYLANPSKCPVCGDTDIEGDMFQVDSGSAWQQVSCTKCHSRWNDLYKLVDVELLDV
jgi:formate dehydrogenase maturation protein FdhE